MFLFSNLPINSPVRITRISHKEIQITSPEDTGFHVERGFSDTDYKKSTLNVPTNAYQTRLLDNRRIWAGTPPEGYPKLETPDNAKPEKLSLPYPLCYRCSNLDRNTLTRSYSPAIVHLRDNGNQSKTIHNHQNSTI